MATRRGGRTGGGPGTNQYAIKGTSATAAPRARVGAFARTTPALPTSVDYAEQAIRMSVSDDERMWVHMWCLDRDLTAVTTDLMNAAARNGDKNWTELASDLDYSVTPCTVTDIAAGDIVICEQHGEETMIAVTGVEPVKTGEDITAGMVEFTGVSPRWVGLAKEKEMELRPDAWIQHPDDWQLDNLSQRMFRLDRADR